MTDDYLDGIMKRTAEQAESLKTPQSSDYGKPNWRDEDFQVRVEPKAPQSASQVEGFKIQVSFQHPSVPVRKFDWVAFYEGEEERREYGYGSTPYMAVLDLINNYSPTLYAEAQKYKR